MIELPSTALNFERETEVGDAIGVKARLTGPSDPEGYKRVGEALALKRRGRANEVWVWVYGFDMDLNGPALCVSYLSAHEGPMTEFIDPIAVTGFYQARMMDTSARQWD